MKIRNAALGANWNKWSLSWCTEITKTKIEIKKSKYFHKKKLNLIKMAKAHNTITQT